MASFVIPPGAAAMEAVGFIQTATLTASTALTSIPEDANAALITAAGAAVVARFDGGDPTASVGHPLATGDHCFVYGDLRDIRLIGAGATAMVTYFQVS